MTISFPRPLTIDEERHYIELWEHGNTEAKDILIERNLRLVVHIAKKYTSPYYTSDDFISIGTIGLIKAIDTYQSTKAVRLSTYASRCIENEILMTIRSAKRLTNQISLDSPIGWDSDGKEMSMTDLLGTDEDALEEEVDYKIQCDKLYHLVETILDSRERDIIINRYGLYCVKPMTQSEVAGLLGISRSYVSRLEKKALSKLNTALVRG
jgi:RNA polymerase sporulation-specific sigma factor